MEASQEIVCACLLASFGVLYLLRKSMNRTADYMYDGVWDHHKTSFVNLDVEQTVADYSAECKIVTFNEKTGEKRVYLGTNGAREFFSLLFSRLKGADGKFTDGFQFREGMGPKTDDDGSGATVFIGWTSVSPTYEFLWATDFCHAPVGWEIRAPLHLLPR